MSSNLRTVAADLEEFLVEQCPSTWRIVNAEKLGSAKTTKVVLTYEQLDVLASANGTDLSVGWVGVSFQLVLSTPETGATKALPRVTNALAELLLVLDSTDQVYYSDATRTRLDTGETAFVLPVVVLATYVPTPEPIPAPEEE